MNWEFIHRWNSVILGLFIVTHLGVHLMAVVSPEAHSDALSTMRQYYAHPIVEGALLFSVAIQIVSGFAELILLPKTGWRVVRNFSGVYLMLFMVVHVASVKYARHVDYVPTDYYWAAGAFAYAPLTIAAIIFYGLGVFSFFAHMIAVWAIYWKSMPEQIFAASWLTALVITSAILLAFSGALYPIDMPAYVTEHYEGLFGPLLTILEEWF